MSPFFPPPPPKKNQKKKKYASKKLYTISRIPLYSINRNPLYIISRNIHLFLFLKNELVPPDNNGSERAIRNFKVKQKVSGFFKTNKGAENYAILRSVCDTAIKNNQNPLTPFKLAADYSNPE
jgi:hypothetical protein